MNQSVYESWINHHSKGLSMDCFMMQKMHFGCFYEQKVNFIHSFKLNTSKHLFLDCSSFKRRAESQLLSNDDKR